MSRKTMIILTLFLSLSLFLAGCTPPPAEREVVIVTRIVTETETVTEVVTREVEVTRLVEVASTPLPGPERCTRGSLDEVDEIVLGATVPLSPPGSVTGGIAMQVAFNLAVNDINARGGVLGRSLRVLVEDTAGTAERGTEVATSLITEECVVALLGEYHSAVALAMIEVAHAYQVPFIVAEAYNDAITAVQYPEVFRIAPTSTFIAQADARWLGEVGDYNGDGAATVVVIAENSDFGVTQIEHAETWYPEFGLDLTTFLVELGTSDFSTVLGRLDELAAVPDAVVLKVSGESSFVLQQQINESGLFTPDQTIIVANQVALNDEAYWENVPDGIGAVVPRVGVWTTTASPAGFAFANSYREITGRWPEPYAFEAYDSVFLMADAIERAGSLNGADIIAALEATDINLAAGHYTFPYGQDSPPMTNDQPDYMWHQWPDVPVLFLQYTEANQPAAEMAVIWPEVYRTSDGPIVRPGE